jgi:hypothetical protein
MNELLKMINDYSAIEDYSTNDFKIIHNEMSKNNIDTQEIDKFIKDISEKCEQFITELNNKFNSLSEEQVKSIDLLNKSNIKWKLKSSWDYDEKENIYTIVVEKNKELKGE